MVEGSLPDPNIYTIFSEPTLTVYWYTKEELYKFSKFNCYLYGRIPVPESTIEILQERGDFTLPILGDDDDWYEFKDLGP